MLLLNWYRSVSDVINIHDILFPLTSRGAPGNSGLHASGEGERVIAPEPW